MWQGDACAPTHPPMETQPGRQPCCHRAPPPSHLQVAALQQVLQEAAQLAHANARPLSLLQLAPQPRLQLSDILQVSRRGKRQHAGEKQAAVGRRMQWRHRVALHLHSLGGQPDSNNTLSACQRSMLITPPPTVTQRQNRQPLTAASRSATAPRKCSLERKIASLLLPTRPEGTELQQRQASRGDSGQQ